MAIKGYWKFNGNSNDYSGNNLNGVDSDVTHTLGGAENKCVNFLGATSRVTMNYAALDFTGSFTLSIMYKPTTTAFIIFDNGLYSSGLSIIAYPTYLLFQGYIGGSWTSINAPFAFVAGKWYHIVIARNSASPYTITAYINSKIVGSATKSGNVSYGSTSEFMLGSLFDGSSRNNGGIASLDRFIADDTALSFPKVKNDYAAVTGFF